MLEEISKSIRADLYERASSPLLGAFLTSWLIWNWKTMLGGSRGQVLRFALSENQVQINKTQGPALNVHGVITLAGFLPAGWQCSGNPVSYGLGAGFSVDAPWGGSSAYRNVKGRVHG